MMLWVSVQRGHLPDAEEPLALFLASHQQRTPELWKCPRRVEKCAKLCTTILSSFSATEKHVWRSSPKKLVFRQSKSHHC